MKTDAEMEVMWLQSERGKDLGNHLKVGEGSGVVLSEPPEPVL